jgi:hypothetical protein
MATLKQEAVLTILTLPESANLDEIIRALKYLQYQKTINEQPPSPKPTETPISFLDAAKKFVGCLKNCPPDLSTNDSYLEGYGI